MLCYWTISASPGQYVAVSFSSFDVEFGDGVCYDWLAAYDGPSTEYPLIGYFCGSDVQAIFSTGQHLTLKMFTDFSVTADGFRGNVMFIDSRKALKMFILSQIRT